MPTPEVFQDYKGRDKTEKEKVCTPPRQRICIPGKFRDLRELRCWLFYTFCSFAFVGVGTTQLPS